MNIFKKTLIVMNIFEKLSFVTYMAIGQDSHISKGKYICRGEGSTTCAVVNTLKNGC
jgi:hypothetical protein